MFARGSPMRTIIAAGREAAAEAWSHKLVSLATVLFIAGMCATVCLTAGRTSGERREVLANIDSAGTRTIVVRFNPDAGIDANVMDRLEEFAGIEWAGGFGPAADMSAVEADGAPVVPVRNYYPSQGGNILANRVANGVVNAVYVSQSAQDQLGLVAPSAGLEGSGRSAAVVGAFVPPTSLSFLEPLAIAPTSRTGPLALLVVELSSPQLVGVFTHQIGSLLGINDPSLVRIQSSERLATLQGQIEQQLTSSGRILVLGSFMATAALLSAVLLVLMLLRRRDFGRRRALGATRSLLVSLILGQTVALSLVGASVGVALALLGLALSGTPLPGAEFVVALTVLAVFTGALAAVLPAVFASRRDPLRELRLP
jgi:putative ABC transport system permease protein